MDGAGDANGVLVGCRCASGSNADLDGVGRRCARSGSIGIPRLCGVGRRCASGGGSNADLDGVGRRCARGGSIGIPRFGCVAAGIGIAMGQLRVGIGIAMGQ